MKKFLFMLLLAGGILASCGETPTNSYWVSAQGLDSTLNGELVYIRSASQGTLTPHDTTRVVDGAFTLKGEMPERTIYYLFLGRRSGALLTTESDEVRVALDEDRWRVLSGRESKPLHERDELISSYIRECNRIAYLEGDTMRARLKREEYYPIIDSLYEDGILNHSNDMLGVYSVDRMILYNATVAQIDSLLELVPLAKIDKRIVIRRQMAINKELTKVGEPFADFTAEDAQGDSVRLSDYVGKGNYVLTDYWSSGCRPCIEMVPLLKELYDKYKEQGFVLLGINSWDRMPNALQTIEREGMTWPIFFALEDRSATFNYGINSFPSTVLYAPDGTILARDLRGGALQKAIEQLYE